MKRIIGLLLVLIIIGACSKDDVSGENVVAGSSFSTGSGNYSTQRFRVTDTRGDIKVEISLSSGIKAENFVFTESEYLRFKEHMDTGTGSSNHQSISALSGHGYSNGFRSSFTTLPRGTYYLVIDNSTYGNVQLTGANTLRGSFTITEK